MWTIANRKHWMVVAASLLVAQTGAALAEGAGLQTEERIIVDGSFNIHKTTHLSGPALMPMTQYTVSRSVSYAGFDLTKQAGMDMFWSRVDATARDLCGELDRMSPVSMSESSACVNTATVNAIQKVTSALAASLEQKQKLASAR